MPFLSTNSPDGWWVVFLSVAALLMYFVGRVAIGVLPLRWRARPLLRATVFAWPVIALSLMAVVDGRSSLAVHLPLASSVMALSIGLATLLMFGPRSSIAHESGRPSKSWALLLPAVAMIGIGSVAGSIDVGLTIGLLLFGLLAIGGWRFEPLPLLPTDDPDPYVQPDPVQQRVRRADDRGTALLLLPMALLIAIGAACALAAMPGAEKLMPQAPPLITLIILAPAIVMPMVFEALPPAPLVTWRGSISTLVLFAIINLCLALPIAALAERFAPKMPGLFGATASTVDRTTTRPTADLFDDASPTTAPTTGPSSRPTTGASHPPTVLFKSFNAEGDLMVPSHVWRADVLALSAACLLLIPMAAGIFRPGWLEALALTGLYFLYLLLSLGLIVQM
ncbi:MAG: hypothetical protein QM770_25305 [Tepidisphaeraceae bacterium]